ncbi:Ankyrin repeat domain-containing protein 17 [Entomortierella beljakovae]|nr:Ankyrin repeat domain-containing protein 17 [Entomortierella beljakovae]
MIELKSQRLMTACLEGNLELVNRIASKFETTKELCEIEPASGYTPLMMAARHGHVEIVEALIRLGHDRDEISRDPNRNNILMITAEHGHQAIFEVYATKFPRSVEMCNKQGWSPLIAAARYGAVIMVEILLQLGADMNHRDEEGNTALHHAASYGHLQTISLLIERGSSATIKNNGGWTAQDFAFSDKVSAYMEDCWRSLARSMTSSPSSFSSLYSSNGNDSSLDTLSSSPESLSSVSTTTKKRPTPLISTNSRNKESWVNNGPLSPILASISGATSPRLAPSNAWSEFKRVVVKQQLH